MIKGLDLNGNNIAVIHDEIYVGAKVMRQWMELNGYTYSVITSGAIHGKNDIITVVEFSSDLGTIKIVKTLSSIDYEPRSLWTRYPKLMLQNSCIGEFVNSLPDFQEDLGLIRKELKNLIS